ncbi:hypothetical protein ZHAS_00018050 [Anopheles sinensis]|uniref:Uncharacterized protein n=1 Tax=Anopheles sinensis TaxID=74873 RepID=A0A084WIG4_ANOSI|nr:hypothetical protein ZHAS_00018050 [Anopheles sinensis]
MNYFQVSECLTDDLGDSPQRARIRVIPGAWWELAGVGGGREVSDYFRWLFFTFPAVHEAHGRIMTDDRGRRTIASRSPVGRVGPLTSLFFALTLVPPPPWSSLATCRPLSNPPCHFFEAPLTLTAGAARNVCLFKSL